MLNESAITVVSGMPRSGTSLMMSILERAGVPLLCDGQRKPDQDNPRGYFEYERVKRLPEDQGWLSEATGKAVKIIYRLLYHLPKTRCFDVLFMTRDPKEIVLSQESMIRRLTAGTAPAVAPEEVLRKHAIELKELDAWLLQQHHLRVLKVDYNRMLRTPTIELERVREFLGLRASIAVMQEAIDPELYRNKESEMFRGA